MSPADIARTRPPAETSTFRLYVMRTLYLPSAVAPGAPDRMNAR